MDRLASIAPLALPTPTAGNPREAAETFEAWFVGFLAKEMDVLHGPLKDGPGEMFAELGCQELGRLVAQGKGIGLREELERAIGEIRDVAEETRVRITSGFGERADPLDGTRRRHNGIDLGLGAGAPVCAVRDGVVRFAGDRGAYGRTIIVDHGNGTETLYAHCATLEVRAGDRVAEGTRLGTVGATGRATGPHLHFEVHQDGRAIDPTGWWR